MTCVGQSGQHKTLYKTQNEALGALAKRVRAGDSGKVYPCDTEKGWHISRIRSRLKLPR